jgi:pilus assembly protein Flp/PilA
MRPVVMLPKNDIEFGQKLPSLSLRRATFSVVLPNHKTTTEGSAMQTFTNSIKQFLVSEDGPTAVEYAVMLALIIVVCLTAIQAVGTNANAKFNTVKNALT